MKMVLKWFGMNVLGVKLAQDENGLGWKWFGVKIFGMHLT